MAVPFVKDATFSDGSGGGTPITAAKLNNIEQGVFDAHLMPAVRVFHNASQSITSSTITALAFNSERFDTAGGSASTQHDTVTNNSRLTCRFAGKYMITGQIAWQVSSSGTQRQVGIRVNGSTYIAFLTIQPSASHGSEASIATIYDLAVNDYVQLVVVQDSGGALNVSAAGNYSPEFSMVRVA
jgi:hypothetical protein